jgi:hypothetical protein
MADISDKKIDAPVSDKDISVTEPAKTPDAPAQAKTDGVKASVLHHDRKKTTGEVVFDRTVYTGIGFGANEIGSLIFTGMFERGPGKYLGKQGFERASEWMVKAFNMKNKIKGGKTIEAHASAKNILMWASLNFIGTVIILPIKILDNHKAGVVRTINHTMDKIRGSKLSQEEIAARDTEASHAVACEPRQTWPTILIGRAAGMLTAIGGLGYLMGAERNEKVKQFSDKALTGAAQKGDAMLGGKTRLGKWANSKEDSAFHYYTRLIGPETLGCLATSVVLEIVSKFMAKKNPTVKDPKFCDEMTAAAGNGSAAQSDEEKPGKTFAASEKPPASHVQKIVSEPQQQLQTGL